MQQQQRHKEENCRDKMQRWKKQQEKEKKDFVQCESLSSSLEIHSANNLSMLCLSGYVWQHGYSESWGEDRATAEMFDSTGGKERAPAEMFDSTGSVTWAAATALVNTFTLSCSCFTCTMTAASLEEAALEEAEGEEGRL